MKQGIGLSLALLGIIGMWSSGFIWVAHFIYQLVTVDGVGFFSAIGWNLAGFVIQLVIALLVWAAGATLATSR